MLQNHTLDYDQCLALVKNVTTTPDKLREIWSAYHIGGSDHLVLRKLCMLHPNITLEHWLAGFSDYTEEAAHNPALPLWLLEDINLQNLLITIAVSRNLFSKCAALIPILLGDPVANYSFKILHQAARQHDSSASQSFSLQFPREISFYRNSYCGAGYYLRSGMHVYKVSALYALLKQVISYNQWAETIGLPYPEAPEDLTELAEWTDF